MHRQLRYYIFDRLTPFPILSYLYFLFAIILGFTLRDLFPTFKDEHAFEKTCPTQPQSDFPLQF